MSATYSIKWIFLLFFVSVFDSHYVLYASGLVPNLVNDFFWAASVV